MSNREAAQDAYAALLDRDGPMVRRYALHLARHRQDAEDLEQETLLKVLLAADCIPAAADHRRAWLFRICRNTWVSSMRRQRPRHHTTDLMYAYQSNPSSSGFEGKAELEAVAASFPAQLAQVVRLHSVEDRPLTETARCLGISRRTATRQWSAIQDHVEPELAVWAA